MLPQVVDRELVGLGQRQLTGQLSGYNVRQLATSQQATQNELKSMDLNVFEAVLDDFEGC